MSVNKHGESELDMADVHQVEELDEVQHVVTALARLRDRTSIPVVKECLEEARLDIIHLTATGDRSADNDMEMEEENPDMAA